MGTHFLLSCLILILQAKKNSQLRQPTNSLREIECGPRTSTFVLDNSDDK